MDQELLHPPLLSSDSASWTGLHLSYHRQPAHETPELSFPMHAVEVGLRYDAQEVKINGKPYRDFRVGNIAIHPAHQPIKICTYEESEFIAIALPPSQLSTIELIPQLFGQDPLILNIALSLKQSLESGTDSPLYTDAMAAALSAHLAHRYSTKSIKAHNHTRRYKGLSRQQLKTALAYIHAHLSDPIHLADLAAIAHLSPHHFATLFKRSTGTSPHQYVTTCRIDRAKQLLSRPDLTLTNISHRVGFRSQSHFTQVFRQRTGLTPNAYRQAL